MIGRRNLRVTAERANFQLGSLYVRAGSAANIALLDVPKRAGVSVTGVSMRVTNCDGTVADYAAAQTDTSWTVDIPASHLATPGTVTRGIAVIATGKGADGETVRSWNIGVGDLCVLDGDSDAPAPGVTWTALRLLDGAPSAPHKGDCYIADGSLFLYDGTTWISATGGSSVTVDPTLTQEGAAADAKAVGDALRGGFTEWVLSGVPDGASSVDVFFIYDAPPTCWILSFTYGGNPVSCYSGNEDPSATEVIFNLSDVSSAYPELSGISVSAIRHLVTPTKTSQLVNDGAPNGGGTPYATTEDIPTVPGAYNSTPAMDGAGSAGSSAAWARGDHVHPSDIRKANVTDLPYALVTLTPVSGAWTVSGLPDGVEVVSGPYWMPEENAYALLTSDGCAWFTPETYSGILSLNVFSDQTGSGATYEPSATRPYVYGATLLDRAANFLAVSTEATLVLPPAMEGKSRDFIVTIANRDSHSYAHLYDIVPPPGERILNNEGNFEEEVLGGATEIFRYTEVEPGRFHRQHLTKTYADPSHSHSATDITTGTFAAARLPVATDSSKGAVQVDGTTITAANGVISVVGGGGNGHTVTVCGHRCDGSDSTGRVTLAGFDIAADSTGLRANGHDVDGNLVFHGIEHVAVPSVPSATVYFNGVEKNDAFVTLDGDTTIDLFCYFCIAAGTMIPLADGSLKPIEEITYDDDLLVWDFDEGRTGHAKPAWIKRRDYIFYHWETKLASGRSIKTCGQFGHRFFDLETNTWVYASEINGKTIYTIDGADVVASSERIDGKVDFFNIITKGHINHFGNGILLGCSLENYLYPVENMRFVKDNRALRPYSEFEGEVPEWWYTDCRYSESLASRDYLVKYCKDRLPLMLPKS